MSDGPIPWEDVCAAEHRALGGSSGARRTALCLSGGGIRSASFAVGVIQGLARHGLLPHFDYLSTVSGGGFAGAWLSAWIHRAQAVDDASDAREAEAAREALRQMTDGVPRGTDVEPWPLTRLREYTRYMSPRAGLFSADTWTLITTMLRNLILNWFVLIPLIAAAMLVPRLHYALIHLSQPDPDPMARYRLSRPETVALIAALVSYLASLGYAVADLPSYGDRRRSERQFIGRCLLPLCVGTLSLTYFWALNQVDIPMWMVLATSAGAHAAMWILVGFVTGNRPFRPRTWAAAAAGGLLVGLGVYGLTNLFGVGVELHKLYVVVVLPLVFAVMLLGLVAFIGFAGGQLTSADLEWWSRAGAWALIVVVAWLAVCSVVFVGPYAVWRIEASIPWARHGLTGVTSLVGGIGAWLARPSGEQTEPSAFRRVALMAAAPAFTALLLVTLACFDDDAVRWMSGTSIFTRVEAADVELCGREDEGRAGAYNCHPADAGLLETASLMGLLLALGYGASRLVPANRFSLHGMYRLRVARAFLGASRLARQPDPFTGFDRDDDLEMFRLAGQRPLPVVNATLNKLADHSLGRQERRCESFTFTPLYAGSRSLGYRPTTEYAGDDGRQRALMFGTAATISGAAASPAMGAYSTPALAFLLALLNGRLGVWLGNPGAAGDATWRRSDPKAGVGPIFREMLGLTTDANPYVYLTDGGHFENLGLWEMVLRRCQHVVIVDASCDPDYTFADLGNAVRLVRIDHGVRIEMDPMETAGGSASGRPHYMTGRIYYDNDRAESAGTLLYVKPALSGDEPIDVVNYAKDHPSFPHESTANQWFTEAQFESYRMLGLHSIETALASNAAAVTRLGDPS